MNYKHKNTNQNSLWMLMGLYACYKNITHCLHLLNRLTGKKRAREKERKYFTKADILWLSWSPKHLNGFTKEKVRSPSFAVNSFTKLEMIRETSAMIFPVLLRPYKNGVFYPSSTLEYTLRKKFWITIVTRSTSNRNTMVFVLCIFQ